MDILSPKIGRIDDEFFVVSAGDLLFNIIASCIDVADNCPLLKWSVFSEFAGDPSLFSGMSAKFVLIIEVGPGALGDSRVKSVTVMPKC